MLQCHDEAGNTPLSLAVASQNMSLFALLLEQGGMGGNKGQMFQLEALGVTTAELLNSTFVRYLIGADTAPSPLAPKRLSGGLCKLRACVRAVHAAVRCGERFP